MRTYRFGPRWPTKAPPEGEPEGGSPPAGEPAAPTLEVVGGDMGDHLDGGGNPDRVGGGEDGDGEDGGQTDSGESTEGAGGGESAAVGGEGGEDRTDAEKPKRVPWHQTRINQLTKKATEEAAEKARLAEENARLRTLLAGGEGAGTETGVAERPAVATPESHPVTADGKRLYTEEEVSELAGRRAYVDNLNRKIDQMHDAAAAADPKFVENVAVIKAAFSDELAKRPNFFEALTDLENGSDVMASLWSDPDRLSEMLSFNPTKMGLEMAKLSGEVKAKKGLKISKAPPPITPLNAGGNISEEDLPYDSPHLSMDKYSARRAKEREARANSHR